MKISTLLRKEDLTKKGLRRNTPRPYRQSFLPLKRGPDKEGIATIASFTTPIATVLQNFEKRT